MSDSMKQKRARRSSPPSVPMGFQFGKSEDLLFIDFLDAPSDEDVEVFSSIALTKKSAVNLKIALENFLESLDKAD